MPTTFSNMSAVRLYFKRGAEHGGGGFWRRMFKKPLTRHLLQRALDAGITHASVHPGHSGFTRGAKGVSLDISEIPTVTLPVCMELVAPRPLLEQFLRDNTEPLSGATLVMLEGVGISLPDDVSSNSVAEDVRQKVEYVRSDGPLAAADGAG